MNPIFDNQIVSDIFLVVGALIRLLGLAALGVGIGWLTLEFLRKGQQTWQLQIAVYLGLVGLVVASIHFLYWNAAGALGAFGIGLGVALIVWGLRNPKDKEADSRTSSRDKKS